MRRVFVLAALLLGLALPELAHAACPEIPAVARDPSTGSPFATGNRGVTRLDTQTSDNARITGGCIDVPNLQTGGHRLRTPATCDGFSAEDGAINISVNSKTFTSASASFAATDLGKKISINGAGPTQYFGTATIAGGGAGHTVGEEIPLTGGTGSAGTVVVRAVSGGAITAVAGKAGSLGSYTAVPSNPVTAGDATLTATWLRDNLVTTIAARASNTQVTLTDAATATVSAALWGYGSDYATEISAGMSTGVELPGGGQWCGIGSTIDVGARQIIAGQGTGGSGVGPTNLLWLGAAGGTILKADGKINGARIGPFNLMGLGAASIGGHFRGLQQSRADLHVTAVKDYGFKLEESSDGLWDTFFSDFRLVAAVNSPYPASRNAVGIGFPLATTSSGAHDVNGNNFYNNAVYHQDGVGIEIEEGYMNNFYLTQLFGTGNGWGIRFGGSNTNRLFSARGNNFYNLISQAAVWSQGGTYGALSNRINDFDTLAYNPAPVVDSTSTLYCITNGTASDLGSQARNSCTAPANTQVNGGVSGAIADLTNYRAISVGTFVPRYTGNMTLWGTGAATNDANNGGGLVTMYYGTGTAPAVGADLSTAGSTRFTCGGFPGMRNPPATTMLSAVAVKCDVPNFGRGITWWFAFGGKATVGGNFSVVNAYISAKEDP